MEDKYLQQLLGANEKIILVTRRHWLFILRNILPELVLILLILAGVTTLWAATPVSGFSALGFLLLFLPFVSLARDLLIWHNNKHIVTSRRVIHMSGVWSKNVIDSSLEKVNDVKMEQSALGRVFNYGDIEILTASEIGVNRFARINNPVGVIGYRFKGGQPSQARPQPLGERCFSGANISGNQNQAFAHGVIRFLPAVPLFCG